jgi:hypothetical protein
MFDRFDLKWADNELRLISNKLLATIERDQARPSLFRIRLPDGHLTEAVSQAEARDTATRLALDSLSVAQLDRPAFL